MLPVAAEEVRFTIVLPTRNVDTPGFAISSLILRKDEQACAAGGFSGVWRAVLELNKDSCRLVVESERPFAVMDTIAAGDSQRSVFTVAFTISNSGKTVAVCGGDGDGSGGSENDDDRESSLGREELADGRLSTAPSPSLS